MIKQENAELTSPHEHIKTNSTKKKRKKEEKKKLTLHVEQPLLKQTDDLQKDSSTIKAIKKDPHGVWQEGRRSNSVRTHILNRGHRKAGDYYGLGDPP